LFSFISISSSFSQNLFVENFNYPVRDSLEGFGGWNRSGGNSIHNVRVISPGLTYSGYLGSGIGNATAMDNITNGDVCLHSFEVQDSGRLYMSFLLRVDSMSSGAFAGYNVCFNPNASTNFNTKPYIKKLTAGTFNFGIEKLGGSIQYSPAVYSTNVTYLVVVKYTFVAGSNNDSAKIYVFNSGVPATEPVVPSAYDVAGSDVDDIAYVAVSNSYAQNGLNGSSVKVDGIRVGKTWTTTLLTPVSVTLRLTSLIQGFYNNVTGKMVKDTVRVYLRNGTAPFAIVDSAKARLDSTGKGNFNFFNVGSQTPYYEVVKHRNSIETWSSYPYEFYQDSLNYDFTPGSYQAYGNNLVLKGLKYCIWSGDVNQDGSVNLTDIVAVFNNAQNFVAGYVATDLNGDNVTNLTDILIVGNNSVDFVHVIRP